jgi:hypothetical protein
MWCDERKTELAKYNLTLTPLDPTFPVAEPKHAGRF